jgi:hypothetical protein
MWRSKGFFLMNWEIGDSVIHIHTGSHGTIADKRSARMLMLQVRWNEGEPSWLPAELVRADDRLTLPPDLPKAKRKKPFRPQGKAKPTLPKPIFIQRKREPRRANKAESWPELPLAKFWFGKGK